MQPDSTKPTSSKHKFDRADRNDFSTKGYMPGMRQEGTARFNPGPGAYSPRTVDTECRSNSKSKAPAWGFGGALGQKKRGRITHLASTTEQCGPGAHNVETSMQTMTR